MDKITKVLRKLGAKERTQVKIILIKLRKGSFVGLDLVKLTGHKDIFRVREGNIRIIFRIVDKSMKIPAIERRTENTYKNF